ncbi:DNA alkylation repair protein [Pseudooceanicola sp. CBS1P-1]|uniref:DNA alkylation repair protein n=1 Tax=Pseudooceanicola albus TaxID=2692189 RepID=A0A6L7FZA0_9RHOB|nr:MULTISPECIES: DNA alkylation repair protein [Pseudooceanicola]MBT9382544.1 DNA alkylation repair protein [Pseudooceanicola endophyticus]MXN17085.1 DNA alkylation repair protein [Pseudooceanicola albus]
MDLEAALGALTAAAEPDRIEGVAAYHKAARSYLGTPNPAINDLATDWRRSLPLDERLSLAQALWETDIHEARIAAAKLLTQARIRPDDAAVWAMICAWVPDFDAWAIADHACIAGQKRVMADLSRLDEIEAWTTSDHLWTKRAALVITLGLTKSNHPNAEEAAARDRVLGWAAGYVEDRAWFIQKAVAWWIRDLSKHDPARASAFLAAHGAQLKGFARKEAGKYL